MLGYGPNLYSHPKFDDWIDFNKPPKLGLVWITVQLWSRCRYAKEKGIYLTASGWDEESVDFLVHDLRVPFLKMASADLTNFPLLEHTAQKGIPMILSTG